jgi:hypothetical protein
MLLGSCREQITATAAKSTGETRILEISLFDEFLKQAGLCKDFSF